MVEGSNKILKYHNSNTIIVLGNAMIDMVVKKI